jgi:hypothetical protein
LQCGFVGGFFDGSGGGAFDGSGAGRPGSQRVGLRRNEIQGIGDLGHQSRDSAAEGSASQVR